MGGKFSSRRRGGMDGDAGAAPAAHHRVPMAANAEEAIGIATAVIDECIPGLSVSNPRGVRRVVDELANWCGPRYSHPGGLNEFKEHLTYVVNCLVGDTPSDSMIEALCGLVTPEGVDLNYIDLMNASDDGSLYANLRTGAVPIRFTDEYGAMAPDVKQALFMRIARTSRWSKPSRWAVAPAALRRELSPMVLAIRVETARSIEGAAVFLQEFGSKCPAAIYFMAQDQPNGALLSQAMAAMRPEKMCEMFRTVNYYVNKVPCGFRDGFTGEAMTRDKFMAHLVTPLLAALESDPATQPVTDSLFRCLAGKSQLANISFDVTKSALFALPVVTPDRKRYVEGLVAQLKK